MTENESGQENHEERSPESERARRDVREALVRYVTAKGTAGAYALPGMFADFVDDEVESLTRDGTLVLFGSSMSYRLSDARVARTLAEYALEFVERSCGPDIDALSERFAEILSGKPPTKPWNPPETKVSTSPLDEAVEKAALLSFPATRANYEQLAAWLRELQQRRADESREPKQKARRIAFQTTTEALRATDETPEELNEAIDNADKFSFPALAQNHELLPVWLRELRQRRADEARTRGPQVRYARDPNPTATALSRLIGECFRDPDWGDPTGGVRKWKDRIRAEAIRIYRETDRESCEMWGELVALLDFVHSEVLKEAIPQRGGQPKPSA